MLNIHFQSAYHSHKVETYLKLNVPGSTVYVGDYIRIWGNLYWIDGKIAKGVPNAPIVIDIPTKSSSGSYICRPI